MGALLGRNKTLTTDPFYSAIPLPPPPPPPAPRPAKNNRGGGLGRYGGEYEPVVTMGNLYGEPFRPMAQPYGGRYAQGTNQLAGVGPWNYGNYYLGNTTMQMMPYMLNKVSEYGKMQAMAMLGNAGLLGPTSGAPSSQMMSNPMCCPSAMQMSAPMMAAASPLPIAYNPLVQGMYPVVTMNPVSWMSPSSFMSALSTGPMPYRPPALDFPSNVNMVMTIPYGTPNPFLSALSSPSVGSSNSFGFGSPTGCCPSAAAAAALPISSSVGSYQCPFSMGQLSSGANPSPLAGLPLIQHIKGPLPISALASPNSTGVTQSAGEFPLWSSQGAVRNAGSIQPPVMSSNMNLSADKSTNNPTFTGSLPVYDATDNSQVLIGQKILPSLSNNNLGTGRYGAGSTPSISKYEHISGSKSGSLYERFRRRLPSISRLSSKSYSLVESLPRSDPVLPPITNGYLVSDSGWLPKSAEHQTIPSIMVGKRKKRLLYPSDAGRSIMNTIGSQVSFIPRRRRRHHSSNSSVSEYDCAICQQQREKRRLNEYYGSSTVSSLLSSKNSSHHQLSSMDSFLSPKQRTPVSKKRGSKKSHRRHEKKIKHSAKTPSPKQTPSPKPRQKSPIHEEQHNNSIHQAEEKGRQDDLEEEEEEEEKKSTQPQPLVKNNFVNYNEVSSEESDHRSSQISFKSVEEKKTEQIKSPVKNNFVNNDELSSEDSDHDSSRISLKSADE